MERAGLAGSPHGVGLPREAARSRSPTAPRDLDGPCFPRRPRLRSATPPHARRPLDSGHVLAHRRATDGRSRHGLSRAARCGSRGGSRRGHDAVVESVLDLQLPRRWNADRGGARTRRSRTRSRARRGRFGVGARPVDRRRARVAELAGPRGRRGFHEHGHPGSTGERYLSRDSVDRRPRGPAHHGGVWRDARIAGHAHPAADRGRGERHQRDARRGVDLRFRPRSRHGCGGRRSDSG